MKTSILVVDDDPTFQRLLGFVLEKDGYKVVCTGSAKDMYVQLERSSFDLVLLDLGLPDEDGTVLLRQLHAKSGPAVIVLTGRREQDSLLGALELGADDYITKPFDPREVLMRVRAVLARVRRGASPRGSIEPTVIRFDGWTLNVSSKTLRSPDNAEVPLTSGEFQVLQALLSRPGWALSRDQLLDATSRGGDPPSPRMIDVYVSQLRAKIEPDNKNPTLIRSVRGHGYKFGGSIQ